MSDEWTQEQMVELLTVLAAADIDCHTHTHGTHTGDWADKPWTGPIAWQVSAVRRGIGSADDWGWPIADIVELNATLNTLGVEAVISGVSEDRGLCLRLMGSRQSRFMVRRPQLGTEALPDPTDRKAV